MIRKHALAAAIVVAGLATAVPAQAELKSQLQSGPEVGKKIESLDVRGQGHSVCWSCFG